MAPPTEPTIYHALPIADDALANGGVEILRAGLIDDELFVTARHAFKDPAPWGQVLADITRRLAQIYSLETDLTEAEALAEIEEAYAADLGAKAVPDKRAPARRKAASPAAKAAKPKLTKPKLAKPKLAKSKPTKPTQAKSKAAASHKPAPRGRGKR